MLRRGNTTVPPVPPRDGAAPLVSRTGTWQGGGMASPSPSAGGMPIAIGAIGGAAIGFLFGEATPGCLIGLAIGIAVALLIWWRGR